MFYPSDDIFPSDSLFPGLLQALPESTQRRYLAGLLYAALGPLTETDNGDLLTYVEAIASMFGEIEDLTRDYEEDGRTFPGWSVALDPDRVPGNAAPWLAQLAGATIPKGASEAESRAVIKDAANLRRGTVAAIVAAAKRHLTGTKTVRVIERDESAYRLTVLTFTEETPDETAVRNAILTQKPAGIVLNYLKTPGYVWNEATQTWDAPTVTWDETGTTPV